MFTRVALCLGLSAVTVWMSITPALAQPRPRDEWVALARGGFAVPAGQRAIDLLTEMDALLGSPDPVLRDEVAYSAAEKWLLRDKVVSDADVVRLVDLWRGSLSEGLGTSGDPRALKRSFSALSLSVAAARHAATPVLEASTAQQLTDQLIDALRRERDLRGFTRELGWVHATAHTADALKFLARASTWSPATLAPLLDAVRVKIELWDGVFVWGEAERLAAMLHAAMRRPDAALTPLAPWLEAWQREHAALWANGPQIDPVKYARVENAKQVLRALHALLAMELTPSAPAAEARQVVLTTLARLR